MRAGRAALAAVMAAMTVAGLPAPAGAQTCATKMIFEVGGHLDPEARVYDASNATLPPGVSFTKIRYSASIAPYPGDPVSMDESVAEGVAKLDRAVRDFHAACPGSHITISGYSQGAIVAGDVLHALSGSAGIPHAQLNGVLYGDPRRPGAGGGPGGIESNLPTVVPGITMRGSRGFGSLRVMEICNRNDGICHSENPITNLLGFANGIAGYFMGDHAYDIDPDAVTGGGDLLIQQPPRVPHGPPLPLPIPTPYELFNGDPDRARAEVARIRSLVEPALPAQVRDRLDEFPWLPA
ncbi:PE-PPE domain-containing protein [Thermoactinospora rubra]|uniref:PE-PPE domain-containing protein n=1 Tax=Thermoactinospora rubra TaxID=1088767 RepID=UPI000A10F05B|nr:PE-PPE domain-containing protein [Thermoactinospora rubra]